MSTIKIERLEKQIKKLESKLLLQELQRDDDLTKVNNHWASKFDMIVGMFEAQVNAAGTISELRKWFADWTNDVDSIDATDPECEGKMDEIISKHGFEFKRQKIDVTYQEVLGAKRHG